MAKQLTVVEFFKEFPNDDVCLEHLMKVRYGLELDCPNCGRHTKFHRLANRPAYSCNFCGHHVYPMAGTPFERTRTSLQKWFYAIYLFTTSRHGVPAKELQRQLGVTYKCAWRMGHEIRKYMAIVDGDDNLGGHVEIDETYVGGKEKNKHRAKRDGKNIGGRGKTIVMGMVERDGSLMTHIVPNCQIATMEAKIVEHVEVGSVISTDEMGSYRFLNRLGYRHAAVNHGRDEYVNGIHHTNTLEGFWSHFKCSMIGTHRSISPKHMTKYLAEFEFRFNQRRETKNRMFDRLIQAF